MINQQLEEKTISEILNRAIQTYGRHSQIWMAVEETAELNNALAKFQRGRNNDQDVITEIADVIIMTEQLAIMFGQDKVRAEVLRKLARLNSRLDNDINGVLRNK